VALGVLTLLADAAAQAPLLCVIDDAQWLDPESAVVLGFAARRLRAERVVMLFAVRDPGEVSAALSGVPELEIGGLDAPDAADLLARIAGRRLSPAVESRLVAGSGGNPLALVELAGELTAAQLAGAAGNVGRELVKLLLDSGEEVGAVTRDPGSAAVPAGARVVGGDPSRPKTLTSALRDVEAVLLNPRAVGHGAAGLLALAGEHGARRVVLLSAVTVEYPAGEARFADAFKAAEDVVWRAPEVPPDTSSTASGAPSTVTPLGWPALSRFHIQRSERAP
jgi:NAD(P)H-binding